MQEVKLTVNGKEYTKTHLMVKDWRATLAHNVAVAGKSVARDPEVIDALIRYIASYFDISPADIEEHCDMAELFAVTRAIDKNMLEAITGEVSEKNAEGR